MQLIENNKTYLTKYAVDQFIKNGIHSTELAMEANTITVLLKSGKSLQFISEEDYLACKKILSEINIINERLSIIAGSENGCKLEEERIINDYSIKYTDFIDNKSILINRGNFQLTIGVSSDESGITRLFYSSCHGTLDDVNEALNVLAPHFPKIFKQTPAKKCEISVLEIAKPSMTSGKNNSRMGTTSTIYKGLSKNVDLNNNNNNNNNNNTQMVGTEQQKDTPTIDPEERIKELEAKITHLEKVNELLQSEQQDLFNENRELRAQNEELQARLEKRDNITNSPAQPKWKW